MTNDERARGQGQNAVAGGTPLEPAGEDAWRHAGATSNENVGVDGDGR
jgi:hypothetical protein